MNFFTLQDTLKEAPSKRIFLLNGRSAYINAEEGLAGIFHASPKQNGKRTDKLRHVFKFDADSPQDLAGFTTSACRVFIALLSDKLNPSLPRKWHPEAVLLSGLSGFKAGNDIHRIYNIASPFGFIEFHKLHFGTNGDDRLNISLLVNKKNYTLTDISSLITLYATDHYFRRNASHKLQKQATPRHG